MEKVFEIWEMGDLTLIPAYDLFANQRDGVLKVAIKPR